MQTNNPIIDAQQQVERYTPYQISQSKTFNLHPSLFPTEEPTEPINLNPGGFNRFAGPATATPAPATLEEQRQALAAAYGVRAQYVQIPEAESAEAAAARAALDARRLARRAEIAAKYGVRPEDYHHIPLEWLDE